MNRIIKLLGVLSFGGLIGFIYGLLVSPKSGAELRQSIRKFINDYLRKIPNPIEKVREKTQEAISTVQTNSQQAFANARETVAGIHSKSDQILTGTEQIISSAEATSGDILSNLSNKVSGKS